MSIRVLKRVIALGLAAIMCMGLLKAVYPIRVSADVGNLLSNAGFETDIWADGNGWTIAASNWDVTEINHFSYSDDKWMTPCDESDKSVKFWYTGESVSTFTQSLDLEPGKYTLSVQIMGGSGSEAIKVTPFAAGKKGTEVTAAGYNNWLTASMEFELSDAADGFSLGFEVSGANGAWGYIDGAALVQEEASAGKPEPVENDDIFVKYVEGISEDFITGMDISSYYSVTQAGTVFYDFDGKRLDDTGFFNLLKECEVNCIRIRVWNDPYDADGNGYGGGNNDLDTAKKIGKLATDAGLGVLIDFHYSDLWADPSKQSVPKAWKGMTHTQKKDAIYAYTLNSLNELKSAGVKVTMVQVGNETNGFFCGTKNWTEICELFNAGSRAVREFDSNVKIALHFTNPESSGRLAGYAKQLSDNNVDYDIFATSYYSYWHGSLSNLTAVLKSVADTYGKKVMVAETSYAYTLKDLDGHGNTIGKEEDLVAGYQATVQGQANMIRDVIQAAVNVGDAAVGVFYWEGAWNAGKYAFNDDGTVNEAVLNENKAKWETFGSGWASSYAAEYDPADAGLWYGGGAVDNQSFFGWDGKALPSLNVFKYVRTGAVTSVRIDSVKAENVEIRIGDTLVMPSKISAVYNDGTTASADVAWDSGDLAAITGKALGDFYVRGTVDGYYGEVVCKVTVSPANCVINSSFENSDRSMWIIEGSGGNYQKKAADAVTGDYTFHFYNASDFTIKISQTVSGLEPGIYCLYASAQGGDAADGSGRLFAVSGGKEYEAGFELLGWCNWQKPEIDRIEVGEDGTVTIGAELALPGGAWGTMDDFVLYKIADKEEESSEEETTEEETTEAETTEEETTEAETTEEETTEAETTEEETTEAETTEEETTEAETTEEETTEAETTEEATTEKGTEEASEAETLPEALEIKSNGIKIECGSGMVFYDKSGNRIHSGKIYLKCEAASEEEMKAAIDAVKAAGINLPDGLNEGYIIYDIKLVDENGVKVVFEGGKINLYFEYPQGTDASGYKFRCYHIKNGVEELKVTPVKDGLRVEADSFSNFVIAYEAVEKENSANVNTGENSAVWLVLVMTAFAAAVFGGFIFIKQKAGSEK